MMDVAQFFGLSEPAGTPSSAPRPRLTAAVEKYNFSWYEDLFAEEAGARTPVNVLAKSYRNVQLHNPGKYSVVFTYNNGMTTKATWEVLPLADCKKAKNLILFIGQSVMGREQV